MAITAITIENFKGIRDPITIELKPITLLFGPNSAGKSTIVQALHYAREIFESQNLNVDKTILGGDSIDLGGFESLVHNHDLSLPVSMRFDLDLRAVDLPRYMEGYEDFSLTEWQESKLWEIPREVYSAWVKITIRWINLIGKPILEKYEVGINDELLAVIETTDDAKQVNLTRISPFNPVLLVGSSIDEAKDAVVKFIKGKKLEDEESDALGEMFHQLILLFDHDDGIPGITKNIPLVNQESVMPKWSKPLKFLSGIWDNEADYLEIGSFTQLLSSLIIGPGELIREELLKFCYIGPLRKVPKRNHQPITSSNVSQWADGLAAYDTLFFNDQFFIEKVNEWLSGEEKLNSGYSIEVKKYRELANDHPLILSLMQNRIFDEDIDFGREIKSLPVFSRLIIRDDRRDIELTPQDIGVGISQVLPVVVAALHRKTGILAIEQPELHIHPAFQVTLGDLFIEQIRERPDLNFILETHSEHLTLRFLRRIRETGENEAQNNQRLSPEELSIYFIEQTDSGISCHPIRVDQDGDFLDRWPKGFFNERVKELY